MSMKNIPKPIRKEIRTTQMVVYYCKCPICKKEIAGRGLKGYEYNLKRHMEDKHKEQLVTKRLK